MLGHDGAPCGAICRTLALSLWRRLSARSRAHRCGAIFRTLALSGRIRPDLFKLSYVAPPIRIASGAMAYEDLVEGLLAYPSDSTVVSKAMKVVENSAPNDDAATDLLERVTFVEPTASRLSMLAEWNQQRRNVALEFRARIREFMYSDAKRLSPRVLDLYPDLPEALWQRQLTDILLVRQDDAARHEIARVLSDSGHNQMAQIVVTLTFEEDPPGTRPSPKTLNQLLFDLNDAEHPVRTRARRLAALRGVPGGLLNTMKKSGSIYLWDRLARGLRVPKVRITRGFPPQLHRPLAQRLADEGGLAQVHLAATPDHLVVLREAGLTRMICHVRDPRQQMLSLLHFDEERHAQGLPTDIPSEVFSLSFGRRVDWFIHHHMPLLVSFVQTFVDLAEDADSGFDVYMSTHESFVESPEEALTQMADFLTQGRERYVATQRHPERGAFHFRKGRTDEWKEVLTLPQQRAASDRVPARLRAFFGWP